MPFGLRPVCNICGSTESQMWSKSSDGVIKCNDCNNKDISDTNDSQNTGNSSQDMTDFELITTNDNNNSQNTVKPVLVATRKSVRNKNKIRTTFNNKLNTIKGKSRRIIFKRCSVRGPTSFSTPMTCDSIFLRGQYFQKGDIVSVEDVKGGIYFGQIRGFLQDQYCEKSAVLTWLLPSENSPQDVFDASTYYLGPEEDIPRKLESMNFVCHAPSDYYKARHSPYPTLAIKPECGFIWTRLGPQIIKIQNKDKIIQEFEKLEQNNTIS